MAQYVTPGQLDGLYKEVYGEDGIEQLIPECAKLIKLIPFVSSSQESGGKYQFPVILSHEQGFSYSNDGSAFDLNDHVAMTMQNCEIEGAQILLRSGMSYSAASRASNGKKAFRKGTELLFENMMESITKRVEISLLHGQSGIAVADSSTNTDTTHTVVDLLDSSFAAGIWSGVETAKINFYNGASLISSGADSIFVVDSVDLDNKTVTVSGTTTGISALDTALGSGDLDIHFHGAYGNEMAGMRKIITNTGTLFSIDAGTYNLWKGNSVTTSGQLSMAKVLSAVSKCVQRGLNEKVVCAVNPDTWANLASDIAALRRYDGSYSKKKAENGSESISYVGQNGEIEIISHNIVKEGECFIFPPKKCKRVGSQDISFKTPGMGDDIFLHLASKAGFELRAFSDQALLIQTPARCAYVSGFTNS